MKEKKPIYKKVWFWILIVLIVGGIGSSLGDDSNNNNDKVAEDGTANEDEIIAKIGEKFDVGEVTYTVNSIDFKESVGGEYLSTDAQGVYLLVNITITNNSDKALSISDSFFKILNDGKTFESDSVATLYESTDSGTDAIWLQEINPDITLTGTVVFDVSQTVVESSTKQLQVQTGFWGTQTGLVNLN